MKNISLSAIMLFTVPLFSMKNVETSLTSNTDTSVTLQNFCSSVGDHIPQGVDTQLTQLCFYNDLVKIYKKRQHNKLILSARLNIPGTSINITGGSYRESQGSKVTYNLYNHQDQKYTLSLTTYKSESDISFSFVKSEEECIFDVLCLPNQTVWLACKRKQDNGKNTYVCIAPLKKLQDGTFPQIFLNSIGTEREKSAFIKALDQKAEPVLLGYCQPLHALAALMREPQENSVGDGLFCIFLSMNETAHTEKLFNPFGGYLSAKGVGKYIQPLSTKNQNPEEGKKPQQQ